MSANFVVLGDGGTHPGSMVSASSQLKTSAGIACVHGDLFACAVRYHGTTPVTASGSTPHYFGKPFLRTGDLAGCGCSVIGSASAKIG